LGWIKIQAIGHLARESLLFSIPKLISDLMISKRAILIIISAVLCISVSAQKQWNQFRGPEGMGVALDKAEYPVILKQQENQIWTIDLNTGVSSPVIWEDMIFLTSHRKDTFETVAINRQSGELIWQKEVIADKVQRFHPISSAAAPSVVTNGKEVISYFGSYGLLCYNMQGDLLWERKLPIERNMYGVSVSPIIYKNQLVFSRDSDEMSYIETINIATGETIWRTDRPNYNGNWATPGFHRTEDKDEILVYGVFSMKSYDFNTGEELWTLPKLTDEPATTPLSYHGLIYVTTYNMKSNPEVLGLPTYDSLLGLYDKNENKQLNFEEIKENTSILSRYDADGEGDHPLPGFFRGLDKDRDGELTREEYQKVVDWIDSFGWSNALIALKPPVDNGGLPEIVWEYEYGVPECPSPLIKDGLAYMVKNGGIVTCLDAASGELKYKEELSAGGPYYASPVCADGKIYLTSGRGVITVLEEGGNFKVLAENNLNERIQATPALVDGKVYVRTHKGLSAYGVVK
jgi:outer membrane protein assembly factor BamB